MSTIPFLKPNIVKREAYWKYLDEIDESRIYSNFGPLNYRFEERMLNEYFDNTGAITTINNATSGLMLAISQLKRPKAKYALMPSFTFAATPLAAIWCGLEPYFIDIRTTDWCMDEDQLNDVVRKLGDDVAVVVPYACFGNCIDLKRYRELHFSGIPVVVDAASSFGATGESGEQFGKGFPGAVVFSFHATKAFAIGEGGAVYSGDENLIREIRQVENFGFSNTRESVLIGLNAKLSEFSCAIALATLDEFQKKIKERNEIYKEYLRQFETRSLFSKGWVKQCTIGNIAYQFVPMMCPRGLGNIEEVDKLRLRGVESRTYFSPPCHMQTSFSNFCNAGLSTTDYISERIISLPLWELMGTNEISSIVEAINN